MTVASGTYRAKAVGEVVLGESKTKGTPFIEFYLQILEGEHAGSKVRWTGYITEKTQKRTFESLIACGWEGESLADFESGKLSGLDSNDVDIVVELESYVDKEGNERQGARVAWINSAKGFVNTEARIDPRRARLLAQKYQGLITALQAKAGNARHNGKPIEVSDADDSLPPF